jgi:hypothetical protein
MGRPSINPNMGLYFLSRLSSDYLHEDSSFTKGSINMHILLVLFPVMLICFQMIFHVHHLILYLKYISHYKLSLNCQLS